MASMVRWDRWMGRIDRSKLDRLVFFLSLVLVLVWMIAGFLWPLLMPASALTFVIEDAIYYSIYILCHVPWCNRIQLLTYWNPPSIRENRWKSQNITKSWVRYIKPILLGTWRVYAQIITIKYIDSEVLLTWSTPLPGPSKRAFGKPSARPWSTALSK